MFHRSVDANIGSRKSHLPKKEIEYLSHFSAKLIQFLFLFEREMFQVQFTFHIKNMSYSLETKIQIVILMAKFESPIMVIHRELHRQEATEFPKRHTITFIYQKFLETGSIEDTTSVPEEQKQLQMIE